MLRALFVLCLLVVAAHAITVDEIRALSNDSRRPLVREIVQYVEKEIKAVAESSVSRSYEFDPKDKPFDVFDREDLIEVIRESFPGFEVAEYQSCYDRPGFTLECWVKHVVKISW